MYNEVPSDAYDCGVEAAQATLKTNTLPDICSLNLDRDNLPDFSEGFIDTLVNNWVYKLK